MTDSIRNLPRYIRQTDAFGWQGADSANGPWRSIPPPQSGTPWQTTATPMNELRQASADVSGVAVLSPAALNVWDRFCGIAEDHGPLRLALAAALRAAADQVVPKQQKSNKDDILIDSLHLSTRTENALKRCKVLTVGDLKCFTFSDLLLIKGFGVASADEVATSLASIGASLADSAQARSVGWSDVVARKAIRDRLLAIAAELDPQP
jgi:hypothetical protein